MPRPECPSCGKKDRILEIEDKSKPLYYSMQGSPVFAKKWKCGNCGHVFEKE
ncbi:hypothetical protein GF325_18880 [Candidatus Bathyarchaeota archaeon]|nr:hypothetical protein [Candidatus Bathyarchaeota archaeon]